MVTTTFGSAIGFLNELGVYDIILPFLLVFTIIFALLEKTKVLGVEKAGDTVYTKKNLNAIVAFVMAFLVVGSTKIVSVINQTLAQVALIAVLLISFMLLAGTMFGSDEFTLSDDKYKNWVKLFMVIIFIGIVGIFMNALGWLESVVEFLSTRWNVDWVASLILIAVIIGAMIFITKGEDRSSSHSSSNGGNGK